MRGVTTVPGDKSQSHRALLLGAMAVGASRVSGMLEGEDVLATAAALRRLGVSLERESDGVWRIDGVGVGGLAEADRPLDLGNAGTGARLLLGLLAGHPFTTFVTGDDSLRARPMGRVIAPLAEMGARFLARSGERLPLAVTGTTELLPISYRLPVASAQVKSAILLAGLHAPGRTTVIEPEPSRDHTERLLRHLGAEIEIEEQGGGARAISLGGQPELVAGPIVIPGDPSSAAFLLVAAALTEGSSLRLEGVGINPLRTGLLECLEEMGAKMRIEPRAEAGGEPLADLTIEAGPLRGIDVPAARGPRMIDEYPILAVAAACARGTTRMNGLAELRVKESDRLSAIAEGLRACGVDVESGAESLVIHGCDGRPPGGARLDARLDHRIAMSFLALGGLSRAPVIVDGAETIDTSFPGYAALMNRLGARIDQVGS
ncbi:MAG TPA: 3-phosphoshikimate 1-carboxyvinyltransferase [Geminicoccaceae bacterium]|nr:3-phosphoshikimate 1-carboxyvinyltransferase [Geminicoccaceae bacterium]